MAVPLALSLLSIATLGAGRPPAGYVWLRGQVSAGNYVILRGQLSTGAYINLAGKVA